MFYKAVVQSSLLYGCETWDVKPEVLQVPQSLHHRAASRKAFYSRREDEWVYPPTAGILEAAAMFFIDTYIDLRQNTPSSTTSRHDLS